MISYILIHLYTIHFNIVHNESINKISRNKP
jgi:hypothetical protein